MLYDKDYFIKKFEAIPSEKIGKRLGEHCALWHVGVRLPKDVEDKTLYKGKLYIHTTPEESNALIRLFGGEDGEDLVVFHVNDDPRYGKTPKERILNKLKSL